MKPFQTISEFPLSKKNGNLFALVSNFAKNLHFHIVYSRHFAYSPVCKDLHSPFC